MSLIHLRDSSTLERHTFSDRFVEGYAMTALRSGGAARRASAKRAGDHREPVLRFEPSGGPDAYHGIAAGEGDALVAAGVESISRVDGYPKGENRLHPRLARPGAIADAYVSMGITAENVAELYGVLFGDGSLRPALPWNEPLRLGARASGGTR